MPRRRALEADIPLRPGARELVDVSGGAGHSAGDRDIGRRPTARALSRPRRTARHFAAIVTREDVANPKPAPDPFLAAAAQLGVAPADCLALEDSYHGITAAHAAGAMPIMVPDMLPVDG